LRRGGPVAGVVEIGLDGYRLPRETHRVALKLWIPAFAGMTGNGAGP
jgi:hypothetical protein